ncbi:16S rRNA (cytidine(1402)-2'-O)-methyltransferase [Slackia heliotrinireducens]
MPGMLYICATPIGNLGDITLRTLDALRSADVVCAEDTRVTGKLLAHFEIEKRLERLDEATITEQAEAVIDRIAAGQTVAFCSDAGMPGVSDPGARLIAAAQAKGVPYTVLPGASAATTAYVASGFVNPKFYFAGFFPRKAGQRTEALEALLNFDATVVFYESPHRLVSALAAIADTLPTREVAVCRELTKIHEEVARGMAGEVAARFAEREAASPIKGEIAIVIGPPTQDEAQAAQVTTEDAALARARELLASGGMTKKDVMRALCKEFNLSRNDAYELVHQA